MNLRTTLGLILFALALLAGQRVMAQSASTVEVWAATHDLGPDAVLTASDVRLAEVHLSSSTLQRYLPASRDPTGSTLVRAVTAGELLPVSSVVAEGAPAAGRSMTLPVTPEHAVGGQLRPGDRVDVFATFDAGDIRARTTLLARSVEVVDLVRQGGFAVGDDSIVGITVAVTSTDAARLAFATHNADIDVVRVDGLEGATPQGSVSGRDFR